MQVTVLGAGSWGTTVASLTTLRNPTLLWARDGAVADEVNRAHTNKSYLPGFDLPFGAFSRIPPDAFPGYLSPVDDLSVGSPETAAGAYRALIA